MSKSNLIINSNCMQCGSCLECGFDFLSSKKDGSIEIQPGTVLDANGTEIKTLKEICPVDAFEIKASEDKKTILAHMVQQLEGYKGIEKPSIEQFRFHKDDYSIITPVASGERRYEYSSDSAAERAALSEFERAMYSKIDTLLLKVITDYRIKVLKPYFTALEEEGSVYADSNKKVKEILQGIKNLMGNDLPSDFAECNVMPDDETTWKMLNKGELLSDELISSIKSEFDYPFSQYDCYWDTDDTEVYAGTDWRGNDKYKDKYCYRDLYKAFDELAKDLLNACGWASNSLENAALGHAEWLVKIYNEKLEKVLSEKRKQVQSKMQ